MTFKLNLLNKIIFHLLLSSMVLWNLTACAQTLEERLIMCDKVRIISDSTPDHIDDKFIAQALNKTLLFDSIKKIYSQQKINQENRISRHDPLQTNVLAWFVDGEEFFSFYGAPENQLPFCINVKSEKVEFPKFIKIGVSKTDFPYKDIGNDDVVVIGNTEGGIVFLFKFMSGELVEIFYAASFD